jgi:hypothetical protein
VTSDVGPSVVYVGGTGRSGSTLLARLLTGVPSVVAVGELRYVLERGFVQDHLCGCGRPFRSCPFWEKVFAKAVPGGDDDSVQELLSLSRGVDRLRYIPRHLWPRLRSRKFQERLDAYGSYLTRLYMAIAEVSGASVILDSSKDPSYAFVLYSTPAVELSIVHLVRDSRAVAHSWTRKKRRPEVHSHVAHMATRSAVRSSILWCTYHAMFEFLSRRVGRVRRVRYEDFVAEPEGSLASLAEWVGAPSDGEVAAVVHDISGNPLRFSSDPLVVNADEEWRGAMPARSFAIVTALTAPLLLRYGYRLVRR